MAQCYHEKTDTRTMIHIQDYLERSNNILMVRAGDTDVLVILIGNLWYLWEQHRDINIWVTFGTGKHFCYYHINESWTE